MLHVAPPDLQFQWAAEEGALGLYHFGPKKPSIIFAGTAASTRLAKRRDGRGAIVNLGCIESVDTFALETISFDGKALL
jgi:hypothetical protein